MKKLLFCQFSTQLLNKDIKKDIADQFYNGIYELKAKDGYYKGSDFWELPLWIAEISGSLKEFDKELYIIKDISQTINDLNIKEVDYILFSVLDINKAFILDIIKQYKGKAKFIIGGYVTFEEFEQFNNVLIFDTVKALSNYFNIDYVYNTDYSLFKGLKIIPRLVLSTGCLNRCKFCTIEKVIIEKSLQEIINQCLSLKDLSFKLVYINDKTFGQAKNYIFLKYAYNVIKSYNKDFEGFIIQTTATQVMKFIYRHNFKDLHITVCEIGLESFNNEILKDLRKPHNTEQISQAIKALTNYAGIKVILNIIIGLTKENRKTYNKTLNYIKANKNKIYSLNIYNLAVYKNTELYNEIKTNKEDSNELKQEKSFYNKQQIKNNNYFYNEIFGLGLKILQQGV